MPHTKPQDEGPVPIDIGKIVTHFFEESPVDKTKGYALLSEVSDEELELFDQVIENSDLGADAPPKNGIVVAELHSQSSDRKVLVKAARYDDQHHPMIAMAVLALKPHRSQDETIESFALFANEYGEGFVPVNFETHRKQ